MGRLIYEAVVNNDVPVLQGSFVCIVALSVLINTLADILYILLNPAVRIRHAH
jgi:peptide/nickel transport system permease protein